MGTSETPDAPRSGRKIAVRAGTAVAAVGALAVGLVIANPASGQSSATPPSAAPSSAKTSTTTPSSVDPNLYPFGKPPAKPDYRVPPPPQDPNLVPTYTTKTTTRIWGSNPFQEAVSVTQHEWPAVVPENNPSENNNVPERPWGLTLVTPDDP